MPNSSLSGAVWSACTIKGILKASVKSSQVGLTVEGGGGLAPMRAITNFLASPLRFRVRGRVGVRVRVRVRIEF